MSKRISFILAVVLMMALAAMPVFAGNGNGMGQGQGQGCINLINCTGATVEYTGVVVSMGVPGDGIVLTTSTGDVTLFGIGPYWYWEKNGFDRPVVGDEITVTARETTVGTNTITIIMKATVDGQTINLRDETNCRPLWTGGRWR